MDAEVMAHEILPLVGGRENIESLTNCVTRLRFVLRDESKADDEAVKNVQGVMGVIHQGGQYQVIIGVGVSEIAEAIKVCMAESAAIETEDELKKGQEVIDNNPVKNNAFNRFFKMLTACIFPFMGLMITSGVIRGLLTLLVVLGVLTPADGTYRILYAGADAILYFLPILVGFSAGSHFGANPYLSAVIGAALLYPDMSKAYQGQESLTFMGLPVIMANYANSFFPVILSSFVTAKVEGFWRRHLPKTVETIFVPCFTMMLVLPLTFLAIGPTLTWLSNMLAAGTQVVWTTSPLMAGVVLGAFWQVIVLFGLHYAFIPILINNITSSGIDPINAVLGMTVMALVGAGLGYSLKQVDKEKRAAGFACSLTAFLGVTEPIIYSLALPEKRPFVAAFVGGAAAGGLMAWSGAAMQGFGNGGIFQAFMMVSASNPMNLVWFGICSAVAVIVSFLISYVISERKQAKENV